MMGDKMYAESAPGGGEGTIRNHLTVAGPGVPAGAVDDTLLGLADILPTVADLARATNTQHEPWSGSSFANLLVPGGSASDGQQGRVLFTLAASADVDRCPQLIQLMTQVLPDLGPSG
jgi:arylsulfatase A-like enzyme